MPRPAKKTGEIALLRPVRHRGQTYRPNRPGHLEAFLATHPTEDEMQAYRATRSAEGALPKAEPKAAPPPEPDNDAEPES